jgi:putative oxidoreductase
MYLPHNIYWKYKYKHVVDTITVIKIVVLLAASYHMHLNLSIVYGLFKTNFITMCCCSNVPETLRQPMLHDITHFGVRVTIGLIFIMHSLGKFESGFLDFLSQQGLPSEMQFPIALAEFVPGVLLILGGLTRISAVLLSVVMLGAIFIVKGTQSFIGKGGTEFEILLLASCLVIIVLGPGKISVSHVLRNMPGFLH